MTSAKHIGGRNLTLALEGRLNPVPAPRLETVLNESPGGIREPALDLEALQALAAEPWPEDTL